jgi:hypothetical protein
MTQLAHLETKSPALLQELQKKAVLPWPTPLLRLPLARTSHFVALGVMSPALPTESVAQMRYCFLPTEQRGLTNESSWQRIKIVVIGYMMI